jgi:hypothetical protein
MQLLNKSGLDQRILLWGRGEKFKPMAKYCEDSPRALAFTTEIEILMPGREHELYLMCHCGLLLIHLYLFQTKLDQMTPKQKRKRPPGRVG